MDNEKELTHIDLFSGIGGFTLAAEWAGFKTVVFCEKEKFCQKVLKKHWSETPIIEEIRDFDGTKYRGTTLLTGGFPCQPFSVAGQRRGKEDDRYLWPEMLRVIGEAKPNWILAENVPGIFRMALDTVLADLEGQDYTTGTFIIPACGLNAPHRRNRIWIVGYSTDNGHQGRFEETRGTKRESEKRGMRKSERANSPVAKNVGNSSSLRLERKSRRRTRKEFEDRLMESIQNAQNAIGARARNQNRKIGDQKRRVSQDRREGIQQKDGTISTSGFAPTNKHDSKWKESWLEVATRFCRVDDGISDRIHRLKALGNAIVPQIAFEIMKNIAWIEKQIK